MPWRDLVSPARARPARFAGTGGLNSTKPSLTSHRSGATMEFHRNTLPRDFKHPCGRDLASSGKGDWNRGRGEVLQESRVDAAQSSDCYCCILPIQTR